MMTTASNPYPSLQVLGSSATDPQLIQGLERALQTLGIGFQHHAGRFLLLREIEAFERNGLRQYCSERGCDLAILPASTAATMRGEIPNFAESLRRRVALLEGVPISALHAVYEERLQLNPGAELLISGAHERDMHTLLVSGGFTFFTDRMQERLSLCETHSNQLEITGDQLTGQVLGDIVDGVAKNRFVEAACARFDLNKRSAIVIGDGANDLLMMADCGLSVAYRAKAIVKEKADVALDNVGLDAVLELL
ncbi:MAG: phosphoserine phosphatase SerB [Pseudomonadota bacterium]